MILLSDILDLRNLQKRIRERYIHQQDSPDGGMFILNYTAKAQYDRVWDNETRRCRGLVATHDGVVVARPFEKFFNADEHPALPHEPFDVFEKLDGSLIVIAQGPTGLSITSRGSFDSQHAIAARAIWEQLYHHVSVPHGQTWCLELIAPWNRIVVDYGLWENLVLLAVIDNETGMDLTMPSETLWPGPIVPKLDFAEFEDIVAKLATLGPDEEGYVIRFRPSGLRVKVKGDEYKRLHRLLTQLSTRDLWSLLKDHQDLSTLLQRVPDEFHEWVRTTASRLMGDYEKVLATSREKLREIQDLPTRKDQALAIAAFHYRSIVFRMLDHKPFEDLIWKLIYPPAEKPFRQITEEDI